jgi:hypothetical protein
MNLTRQVHPTLMERAAAGARLRIMDALTKINPHGFAFTHRDSDSGGVACENKLLGVLPRPPARDRIAVLNQMTA